MQKGLILCCHGTRSNQGIQDTVKLLRFFKKRYKDYTVKIGYLEITKPTIENQLEFFFKKKFDNLLVVPAMIFSGNHVTKDIPKIINNAKKKFKKLPKINFIPPIIKSKKFFNVVQNNSIKNLLKLRNKTKTGLVVVASNTINTYAKTQINLLAKKISKKNKFNFYRTLLVTLNKDNIKKELKKLVLNYEFIILPIFLFRGYLLENLKLVVKQINKKENNKFILCSHLKDYKEIYNVINNLIKSKIT